MQQRHAELGVTVRVVDWALDPRLQSWEAIWDYGALALLTDCVYFNMADYEYTYIGQSGYVLCFSEHFVILFSS